MIVPILEYIIPPNRIDYILLLLIRKGVQVMTNYWLSEYSSSDDEEMPDEEMPEEGPEDEEDPDDPEEKLNNRQKLMYKHYEHVVEMFGKFDQTAKENGAHYAPAAKNPFVKEGLVCSNCVYFKGGQACEIVAGKVEPNGICKLWIIPSDLIKK